MMFLLRLATTLLLSLCAAFAFAGSFAIYNNSDITLQFQTYDPARGTWKEQSLTPYENKSYTITEGVNRAKFRIATQNRGQVEYLVGVGGVYRLSWNQKRGLWDLSWDTPGYGDTRNPAQPAAQNSAYRLGDAVLVKWKNKWYNATVIQVNGPHTFIHYDGYDNGWDEWVGSDRIRPR
ncbi:Tudor-knot domain-containing protein [Chitinilyticum piscinae]|uniref:Tudor-knot domain-containing protein n=1 Tax=Chitinilyticum piscinae TaxID=2866724 RepID=A0A8J7FJT7_9NEIS|nr:Tudor-knot domain-containing protein [Chitinilyticum piscinae]MBE9610473.1 hypothetical protein [Chitinilyticum piscinae]